MRLYVYVLASDIASGRRECENDCALALAITRAADASRVEVLREDVRIYNARALGGGCWRGPLPEIARRFVRDFDHARHVDPIEFELELQAFEVAA